MVMVRLNHITTRYHPQHYQSPAAFGPSAQVPPGPRDGRQSGLQGEPKAQGQTVLDDLSLTILPGETLSVVGPSGCGKSTLLRVIAGLIEPVAGEIYFDGQRVNEQPPQARHIGMVFQNYALYPHMAAEDNLGFFWRLRRRPAQEITEKVRQTSQVLGVGFNALLGRFPR
ncbi:MAG: ATP-binding cassette domain-containing protein, partial [Candidatus Entotheonellia bacterium]